MSNNSSGQWTPTLVAYRASCGTINILTCEAPSERLLPKEDCIVTPGIKTCNHIDWVGGVLKLATTSTATSTTTLMPSSTDTTSVLSASDSIHKGNFVVFRIHGVKAGSEFNYVALVTMTSGDKEVHRLPEQDGWKFSIVDPKEWMGTKLTF